MGWAGWGKTGIIFATLPVTRIRTKPGINAAGEATKKVTSLQEIDVFICNIFSRINHDCYERVERWAVLLEFIMFASLDCAICLHAALNIFTYTEATQTILTWEL